MGTLEREGDRAEQVLAAAQELGSNLIVVGQERWAACDGCWWARSRWACPGTPAARFWSFGGRSSPFARSLWPPTVKSRARRRSGVQPLADGALKTFRRWWGCIESQIGTRAQLVPIAARMRRFWLHGTFGDTALCDIVECVVWNSQAMRCAISSSVIVVRTCARSTARRKAGESAHADY